MFVIVASVTLRGPFVDDSLRGPTEGIFSVIEPKVFEAIGVMSFAVSECLLFDVFITSR